MGGTDSFTVRLTTCNTNLFVDSVTLDAALNDGYLVTTTDVASGFFVPADSFYDFQLLINTDGVSAANVGARSGLLRAYVHSNIPPGSSISNLYISVYVVPTLCLNRKVRTHSATNSTDVGTQGSIKDQGGNGMFYPANGSDRFYDGGVLIANSALNAPPCATGPRKVTRQLFNDKFLQCVTDGILDSVPGTGSYYNLYVKSIATDVNDTTLVWQNIWEQSTHPDSSDFLIQTTRVINIGNAPIDSVALGVLYDIDVNSASSFPASNHGGDTIFLADDERYYRLAWLAGALNLPEESCKPNNEFYGVVIIPESTSSLGDTIGAHGLVIYKQAVFTYNIDCNHPAGGDSLVQRYAWNIRGYCTPQDGNCDSLTGYDSLTICFEGGLPPAELGYLAIAKKVYNFPVNGGGQNVAARYGLEGLAASIDTNFSGPGETFTVIHIGSNTGISGLIANAQTAVAWYNNHANSQVGTKQTALKGDLNDDGQLSPADVVLELNYVFLNIDVYAGRAIPVCVADLNNTGDPSPVDAVTLLNGAFMGTGCPNCLRPCI